MASKEYYIKNKDKIRARQRLWYHKNKARLVAKAQRYVKDNPSKILHWNLVKYGLSGIEYTQLVEQQRGLCKVCSGPPKGKSRLCVDHNHGSGKIRGLLCDNCNRGLGLLRDSISILEKAIEYLRQN